MSVAAPSSGPSVPAAWRGLAWVALPLLAVLVLRALLSAQAEGDSLQRLQAATLVSDPGEAFWMAARPLVWALSAFAGVVAVSYLALRRWGWARVRPWALVSWVLFCIGTGVWLIASELNRVGRQPLAEQTATVLLARAVAPSQRGPGGTEVYFELPGSSEPMRLLAEGQPTQAFVPGSTPALHLEAGRWWGRWGRLSARSRPAPAAPSR